MARFDWKILIGLKKLWINPSRIQRLRRCPFEGERVISGVLSAWLSVPKRENGRVATVDRKKVKFCILYGLGIGVFLLVFVELLLGTGFRNTRLYKFKSEIAALKSEARSGYRILILGDSFSDRNVEDGLGQLLKTHFEKKRIKVRNYSQGGNSPVKHWEHFKKYGRHFSPNVIMINYYVGNDLTETENHLSELKNSKHPAFYLNILSKTYLYNYIQEKMDFYAYQRTVRRSLAQMEENAEKYQNLVNPHLVHATEHKDYLMDNLKVNKPILMEAWEWNRKLILSIKREADLTEAKVLVNIFPRSVQVNESHFPFWENLEVNLDKNFLIESIPQNLMLKFCREKEIECHDLLPMFRSQKTREFYLENDDHWNKAGNAFAYELIIARLQKKGWLVQGSGPQ